MSLTYFTLDIKINRKFSLPFFRASGAFLFFTILQCSVWGLFHFVYLKHFGLYALFFFVYVLSSSGRSCRYILRTVRSRRKKPIKNTFIREMKRGQGKCQEKVYPLHPKGPRTAQEAVVRKYCTPKVHSYHRLLLAVHQNIHNAAHSRNASSRT